MPAELTCDLLHEGKPGEPEASRMADIWAADLPVAAAWNRTLQTEGKLSQRGGRREEKSGRPATGAAVRWDWLVHQTQSDPEPVQPEDACFDRDRIQTYPTIESAQSDGWGHPERSGHQISAFLHPNFGGKILVDTVEYMHRVTARRLSFRRYFKPRALRVRLALYRWQLVHPDVWPDKLDELVPDYLPAVPLDPWNGQPLIWDATTLTISAVGSDWKAGAPTFQRSKKWFSDDTKHPGLRLELPPPPPPPTAKPAFKPPPKPTIKTTP